jgi:hypothetical protein
MKILPPVLALATLTACQSARYIGDESSPYYVVPVGSRLVLNRDLTIPANQVGVYLQGGQLVSYRDVNQYHPHCKFEVRTLTDAPRTVRADEFMVMRATQQQLPSVRAPIQVAGAGIHIGIGIGGGSQDGGPSPEAYATRLVLKSERQPDVLRLTCGHWDMPNPYAVHLSISQIRKTLGDVMSLRILASPGSR